MQDRNKNRDPARAQKRALTDARCAWRKMNDAQRGEFLRWIGDESPAFKVDDSTLYVPTVLVDDDDHWVASIEVKK